jgi:hypothetical protein
MTSCTLWRSVSLRVAVGVDEVELEHVVGDRAEWADPTLARAGSCEVERDRFTRCLLVPQEDREAGQVVIDLVMPHLAHVGEAHGGRVDRQIAKRDPIAVGSTMGFQPCRRSSSASLSNE